MRYKISHKTAYLYSEPASLSQNELRLHPIDSSIQRLLNHRVLIEPHPEYAYRRLDYFGNRTQLFMVQAPHTRLSIHAISLVETQPTRAIDPAATLAWENAAWEALDRTAPEAQEAQRFAFASPMVRPFPELREYVLGSFKPQTPLLAAAMDLMNRIHREFQYDAEATTVETTIEDLFLRRKGVCQDFAHLMIGGLRSLGLAARYVSGYLETSPPPGKPKLVGSDASHAWLSLFVPGWGWVDLDPTNNRMPSETHITLGYGRDYADVAPVKGVVMGGGEHQLKVMVDVTTVQPDR